MKAIDASNRPLRILEKALQGGLGRGNLGVVMARHGTGKVAVLTSITIDHAMHGKNTLHVAVGKSVSDIRAYDDEVLHQLCTCLGVQDRTSMQTTVERHKQIYTFADGRFSVARLRHVLGFLAEHAEFRPELVEIQGWPRFRDMDEAEMRALKDTAVAHGCEIWMTAHKHREDQMDAFGVPLHLARFAGHISVLLAMEPEGEHIPIRFIKVHESKPPSDVRLEFDPATMLIRWR